MQIKLGISKKQWILAVSCLLLGVLLAPTIGELVAVAMKRRGSFLSEMNNNVYGDASLVQILVVIVALLPLLWILKKFTYQFTVFIFGLVLLGLASAWIPSLVPKEWCEFELTMYPCVSLIETIEAR